MEELPNQIVFNSINRVLFPLLAQRQHDSVLLRQTYGNVIRTITCIVTPFLAFLLFVAEPLFEVLLTKKWVEAVPYFKILLIAGMLSPIQPYLLNICKVKSRSDLVLKLSIVEYFFIFLSILGIFFFGMYGLLWGLVFATAVKVISAMYFAGRLIDYSMFEQCKDLGEGFLLAIIGLVVVFPLSYYSIISITNNYFYIIVYGLIFYAAIVTIAVLFNFKIVFEIKALLKRRFK
jgi:O-antigen/teichoic acid export membrane protein